MEKLKYSLELYHMNTLKEIAQYLQLDPYNIPARKAQLVRELEREITQKAKSSAFISTLGRAERATLGLLLEDHNIGTQQDIALPLMMAGLVYVEGQASTMDQPTIESVIRGLLRRGLLINYSEPGGSSTRRTFETALKFGIAPEVQAVLPRDLLQTPSANETPLEITTPPHVERGNPEQFLRNLFFFWAELRRKAGKQLKAGGLAKRDRRRVAKGLGLDVDEDADQIAWLYTMLETLNLLEFGDGTIGAADNDAVTLFWGSQPISQLREIIKQYPKIDLGLDIDARQLAQYTYYSQVNVQIPYEIRSRVLAQLEEIAKATWISFGTFVTFLNAGKHGNLALSDYTLRSLYSNRWYNSRGRGDLGATLQQLDQQVALSLLQELQAIGVLDLGYQASQEIPSALQVTDLARAYFTNTVLPPPDVEGQVILQPDFQLLAMGPVPLRTLANLERFAEREKLDESVITYRVTRDSVYMAFQRGETVSSLLIFLEDAAHQAIPQNVKRSLEDWGKQYERIVVRRKVTVVQLDAPQMLDVLLEDSVVQRYLHRLDERTAWAHTENVSKIEKRMRELDMLPTYSQGPEADLPGSLRWQDDELHARHPLPSLYVTGTIRRIAEEITKGWKLTRDSIRTAVSMGMDVPEIISLVEEMTGTSISSEWEKRLKAWGNYYGEAEVAQVRLLHMETADALQELRRADRRLRRWIRPLPRAKGVGVVNDKHWEEIGELLAEWGIDVKEQRWW